MAKRKRKAKKSRKAKKHHAKPAHHAAATHAPRKSKQSNNKWVVGGIVVLAIVLYLLFSGGEAPVPEAAPEPAPAEPEIEPSEVEISQGYTKTRESITVGAEKLEGSFFGGVKCAKDVTEDGKDDFEFQVKNMADVEFTLRHVKVAEMNTLNPLRLSINGHNLRKGIMETCGKDTIAPGEILNCKTQTKLRHFGPTGKKSENVLKAEGRVSGASGSMVSVFKFFC